MNCDHIEPNAADAEERRWLADMNRSVAGISFFDSVAVIEKFSAEKNRPFRRIYSGSESEVAPAADWMAVVPRASLDAMLFGNAAARALDAILMAQAAQAKGDAARAKAQLGQMSAGQAALEEAVENGRRARDSSDADARASRDAAVQASSAAKQQAEAEVSAAKRQAEAEMSAVKRQAEAEMSVVKRQAEAEVSAAKQQAESDIASANNAARIVTESSAESRKMLDDSQATLSATASRIKELEQDVGLLRNTVRGRDWTINRLSSGVERVHALFRVNADTRKYSQGEF